MNEWTETLRQLADDPDDVLQEGSTVLFVRHGTEHSLSLVEAPTVGLSVATAQEDGAKLYVPISTYIQRDILGLPRLAGQIGKVLEKSWTRRPVPFIDGPAEQWYQGTLSKWAKVSARFSDTLRMPEAGTTHLVQLMAPAGQGKTALLEHLALGYAHSYKPDPYPHPLLLPVDLLGRYVGTVEDAIAGALNNTFLSPGLSQRDVVTCIRRRWILLALDGFDELVARIGVRDAFNRITELLDQLRASGTIILSARESFFQLHRITTGISTYLQPKVGSFASSLVNLLPWGDEEAAEVFGKLKSKDPQSNLRELLAAFDGDKAVVYHPFFLSNLAELWLDGERFAEASQLKERHARSRYVIETFVKGREAGTKWKDRSDTTLPLLTFEQHCAMMGSVAAEMWNSGAFRLDLQELTLASEIGLTEAKVVRDAVEDALKRVPNHATLRFQNDRYRFAHEKFFHFFLGYRLAALVLGGDRGAVERIVSVAELSPEVRDWVAWYWASRSSDHEAILRFLNAMAHGVSDSTTLGNLGYLAVCALPGNSGGSRRSLMALVFVGDAFSRRTVVGTDFSKGKFWKVDLAGARLLDCTFSECVFGDIHYDSSTSLAGTKFENCEFNAIESKDGRWLFAPAEVRAALTSLGATFAAHAAPIAPAVPARFSVRSDVLDCVQDYVRRSALRTWDVALGDMEERWGKLGREIARIGLSTGLFRPIEKQTSGPKKEFVRFAIDRDRVLRGQVIDVGVQVITRFWEEVSRKYPG